MKSQIFKVQLPIFSTEDIPLGLIYNKQRTITLNVRPSQVKQWFENGERKVYLYGKINGNTINFSGKAPPQEW